ncbi:MAG TPA: NAD(P)-dependent oxidoreductase [Anaerolineae bacterium]|nr:NAD(P)-dependent oxidoreductase [Anaerolineae bacterium]
MAQPTPEKVDRKARSQLTPVPAKTRPPDERVRDFREILILHTPEEARAEASRCLQCANAPCQQACPLHNDIPQALDLLAEGDFAGAAAVYRQTNPLPEVCGRVCPERFCQDACTLKRLGKPLDTRRLEAFVSTYARETAGVPLPEIAPATGKRVAVVGAGPAGLTVAETLTRLGHTVVVFEHYPAPGGMMLYGIPRFKLGAEIVQAKIAWLQALGIEIRCHVTVGRDVTLPQLLAEYDAVFLGAGAQEQYRADIPGETLAGVYDATQFLCRANLPPEFLPEAWQAPLHVGPRVHVIGGGNTAIDCIRTAIRLPGVREVTCYYRRSMQEMPAEPEEYRHALEEWGNFVWLTCPVEFLGDETGHLRAITYQRMKLGAPDESGRCRPECVPGLEITLEVNTAVLALGYRPAKQPLAGLTELRLGRGGVIEVDAPETGRTSVPRLFAAGDVVHGAHLLAPAVADALSVARVMDAFLRA